MKYKIAGTILLAFIFLQFIPYGKAHINPAIVSEPKWDNNRTKELFSRSCLDCHSHKTKWPWYSNIAPVSWLIQHDVNEARQHFNISTLGVQKHNESLKAAWELNQGEMPPWLYLLPRPGTKLNKAEKEELVKGLTATFNTSNVKEDDMEDESDHEESDEEGHHHHHHDDD